MGTLSGRVILGVRLCAGAMVAFGSWSLFVAMSASSASAATTGGTATLAAPGTTTALTGSQPSDTVFTVVLPFEAACSADTSTAGTHEFSYLVPSGTAVSSLTFVAGFASNNLGLVDNNGNPWDDIDTAPTTGDVIGIGNDYEWAPLVSGKDLALTGAGGLLYSGTTGVWEAGIACANSSGVLTDNWNTEVTFTASGSDPEGFVWSAVPGVVTTTTTTTTSASSTTTASTTPTTTATTTTPTSVSSTTTSAGTGSTSSGNGSTTTAVATAASSGSSGSSGSDGSGTTATSSGALAFTGAEITRGVAIGLLCIGFGLILLGFSVKLRRELAPRVVVR